MRALVSPRYERLLQTPRLPSGPETTKQLVTLWSEPKGIDSKRPLSKINPEFATDSTNFMFLDGQLRSRYGTRLVGHVALSTVLQTTDLIRANGKKVTIRFCTRHIEIFNYATSVWRNFPLDLHGSTEDLFTWTSWADKLLFSNFVDGLWELDFQTYVIKKVPGAPGAKHLTVFGNRVVATAVNKQSNFMPQRIQWSVKNNYLDWTGIGSGSEDMYGASGGVVDEAMATHPITDEAAYVIRAGTVWQMSVSGVATAPFRFSRLLKIGSPYRYSIVNSARGVVFLNSKSVYVVSPGSFEDIGQSIIKRIKESFSDLRGAYAIYDNERDEYRVTQCYCVFRYRWDEAGWTKDRFAFTIKSLGMQVSARTGYPIDSLAGIIDDLEGTIDDLVIDRYDDKFIYLVPDGSLVSLSEDPDESDDQLADESFVDAPLVIDSGVANIDRLESNELLEGHLEYEAEEAQDMTIDFLKDSGNSFETITTKALGATTTAEISRVNIAQVSRKHQFRLRSTTLGKLTLLSFTFASVRVHRAS